jgi:hypothetical protein
MKWSSQTESLESPLVGDELLRTSETHLLETSPDSEDDAADDHLVDALPSSTDQGTDSSRDSTEHEKPPPACDV